MSISKEDVDKVAKLARLEFEGQEIEKFTSQLVDILGYIEQLNELDTEEVEPTAHILPIQNVFRPDRVTSPKPSKTIFENAPKEEGGQFKVPQVIE